jgi:hypothetical protein
MTFTIQVTPEIKNKRLFVATPCYGGQCTSAFARSLSDLSAICTHYGIQLRIYMITNESLIPRARNYAADEFLRSGDTHMLFIDADICFNPKDVIHMLALQSSNPEDDQYDVICAPYPKKTIAWEKIKTAVYKGFAEDNPNDLEKFVGDYVFNPADGKNQIPLGQPAEILEAGTGFMMIRRNTLEKFADHYQYQHYKPDHFRTEHFDGSREIVAFFDCPIDGKRAYFEHELAWFLDKNPSATHEDILTFSKDPNITSKQYSKRYLSEDYMFCQWVRNIGLKVWLLPWIQLQHIGTYTFGGSLADLAQVGASATCDSNTRKK